MTGADEQKLIAQARAGSREAFAELVRAHQGWVFHLAYQCLANQQDAEDAAQEVFVCAFRNLRSYRGEAAFGTWLRRIALNVCLARLRRRPPSESLSALEEESAPRPTPPKVGTHAPDVQVARWLNGASIKSLRDLRGKVVVLQFSSAFNNAAKASNEMLKALHGKAGVVVLAIYDASASADEVAAYAKAEKLPFPIGIVEETKNLGADSAAFKAYGVRQLPTVFVIDQEGILQAVNPTKEELTRLTEMR
jgi:RNA polymerase sigma factor (sigma-70 family)